MPFVIMILAVSLSIDALGVGISYGLRKIHIPLSSKIIICIFSIIYSGLSLIAGKYLSAVMSPLLSKLIGMTILVLMGLWIISKELFKGVNSKDNCKQDIPVNETDGKTLFKIAIKSMGVTIQIVKNPEKGDIDRSGVIDKVESMLLGFALSLDAIGVGIGSGLAGFHSFAIPFSAGLFQLLFLYAGLFLGQKFSQINKLNGKVLSVLPGILLIALALLRL